MIPWFILLLFSNKNYFWCSIVVLMSVVANVAIIDIFRITNDMNFVQEVGVLLKLDGFTAITLTYLFFIDKLAFRMCLLIGFAVLSHFMVIYELTVHTSYVSRLFYNWYEVLIFTIGLLQMAITINGIISAPRNVWRYLQRFSFYSRSCGKGLSVFKAGKHS